jgi:hypothetical protein
MLAPFVTDASLGARMYSAGLNFVLGVAIGSLIAGTGKSAIVPVAVRPVTRPYPGPYR